MSAIGFALGTTSMVALGVQWSWLIILVAVVGGAILAVLAILADLPMALLTILTAMAGVRATARLRGSLRASWVESGGRQMRAV